MTYLAIYLLGVLFAYFEGNKFREEFFKSDIGQEYEYRGDFITFLFCCLSWIAFVLLLVAYLYFKNYNDNKK